MSFGIIGANGAAYAEDEVLPGNTPVQTDTLGGAAPAEPAPMIQQQPADNPLGKATIQQPAPPPQTKPPVEPYISRNELERHVWQSQREPARRPIVQNITRVTQIIKKPVTPEDIDRAVAKRLDNIKVTAENEEQMKYFCQKGYGEIKTSKDSSGNDMKSFISNEKMGITAITGEVAQVHQEATKLKSGLANLADDLTAAANDLDAKINKVSADLNSRLNKFSTDLGVIKSRQNWQWFLIVLLFVLISYPYLSKQIQLPWKTKTATTVPPTSAPAATVLATTITPITAPPPIT